ncbi:MAG: hypothetical protein OHK0029_30920 [Armatimonadaceae bacterium]
MKTKNNSSLKFWTTSGITAGIVALALTAFPAQAQTTIVQPGQNTETRVTQMEDGTTMITVTVNNERIVFPETANPMMMDGRVMVPLRGVVERLGGNIKYDPASKVITGAQPNIEKQFRMRVGSKEALLNGQTVEMDTMPRVLAGTTYVPLRFVTEALGAAVEWNSGTRTVTIMADGYTAEVAPNRAVSRQPQN